MYYAWIVLVLSVGDARSCWRMRRVRAGYSVAALSRPGARPGGSYKKPATELRSCRSRTIYGGRRSSTDERER